MLAIRGENVFNLDGDNQNTKQLMWAKQEMKKCRNTRKKALACEQNTLSCALGLTIDSGVFLSHIVKPNKMEVSFGIFLKTRGDFYLYKIWSDIVNLTNY